MKICLICLLLSIGTVAMAQQSKMHLRTRISDNEKTLSIKIDGMKNGRKIQYEQSFDVTGMYSLQKELIKYNAFADQGLSLPIHELSGLIGTGLGLIAVVVALILLIVRRAKIPLTASSME